MWRTRRPPCQLDAASPFLGTAPPIRLAAATAAQLSLQQRKTGRWSDTARPPQETIHLAYPCVLQMLLWRLKLPAECRTDRMRQTCPPPTIVLGDLFRGGRRPLGSSGGCDGVVPPLLRLCSGSISTLDGGDFLSESSQTGSQAGWGGEESRDERRDWSLGFPTVDHRVRETGEGLGGDFRAVTLDLLLPSCIMEPAFRLQKPNRPNAAERVHFRRIIPPPQDRLLHSLAKNKQLLRPRQRAGRLIFMETQ